MKVLIVDDDSFSRKILRNLLGKFECSVLEATDGVGALDVVYREEPDLVLLDVVMPVLNGLETLRELRTSGSFSRIPVVAVSARSERSIVTRFIDLGISGFLLKPLRPQETLRRLEVVFQQIAKGVGSVVGSDNAVLREGAGRTLLLADPDPNFLEFAGKILKSRFKVIQAATGAAAWQEFSEHNPEIVLVGDGLQLIGPDKLLEMIRSHPMTRASVYLLTGREGDGTTSAKPFDGVIRSSFVPEEFSGELSRVLFGDAEQNDSLRDLIGESLAPELVTATIQTIGVMTSQDVSRSDVDAGSSMQGDVLVRAELVTTSGEAAVVVGWAADRSNAERIGSKILGTETSFEDGISEAISGLASTIAGRVRSSIAEKGVALDPAVQNTLVGTADATEWALVVPFETADGEQFRVGVAVEERKPGQAAAAA